VSLTIGVLALQGSVREHRLALEACSARTTLVRRPEELAGIDGLVIPGGESTTIARLLRVFGLDGPLRARVADGLAVYGTCAGMILLADRVIGDGGPRALGGLDVTVRRNAFGRQTESFETNLAIDGIADDERGGPLRAVFIRAPWVEQVGPGVRVLARTSEPSSDDAATPAHTSTSTRGRIVAVQQGRLLATAFHPEITGDHRVHEHFVQMCTSDA